MTLTVRSADEIRQAIRTKMEADGRFHILMAQHLGISQKHLSQVMNGRAGLSLPLLFDILGYLDLTLVLDPPHTKAA